MAFAAQSFCLHKACRLRGRLLVDIDDDDRPAHPRQPQRDGATDITTAAGDKRHRPAQFTRSGHDFRKSQPPSSSGRHASLGGMVWITL